MVRISPKNLGILGVEKYAYPKGQYYHFEISMGQKRGEVRELHLQQIENRSVFPILANHERFGGLLLRDNKEQGRMVRVLTHPFARSLDDYLTTHLPPAASFYDLKSKKSSADELNRTMHLLRRTQTFNMPLLIYGKKSQEQQLGEYRFSDFWDDITSKGLQRKMSDLRADWEHKLSMFDQFMNVALGMVLLLRMRDPYTATHSVYVAMLAYLIGEELGMTPLELEFLKIGGIYHDVGKIGIRDEVLKKPGKLSQDEFRHMKQHPVKGLKATSFLTQGMEEWDGWTKSLQSVQREHHLRYDGKGYPVTPKSLSEIPLFSWIIGMADAFDAMTTMRPYVKRKSTLEEKTEDIIFNSGKQFHPKVANACLELLKRGVSIKTKFPLPSISNI